MPATEIAWKPSVADVAALIRARTKQAGGGEAGTFNEGTRPTAEQAELLIEQAVRRVASQVGIAPCNDDLQADAKDCAAVMAAMLIEQSYFPEQTNNAGSAFKNLKSLWDESISALVTAVSEICGGPAGAAIFPRSGFPSGQLVGETTLW